nr:mechanosensitive ion channel domain-containing protein [uncultured Sulfurimonas sp.]
MKLFYLFFLLSLSLFGATVDNKLYEGDQRDAYYDEIKKQINKSAIGGSKSDEVIKEEILQLSRVRDASSKKIQVESYDLKLFSLKSIDLKTYYEVIAQIAVLENKQDANAEFVSDLQSKLLFLKKKIEDITEDEKVKLLSLQLQFAYYKLQQKNIDSRVSLLKDEILKLKESLLKSFKTLNCEVSLKLEDEISLLQSSLLEKKQEIIAKELQKEKALIEESSIIDKVDNNLVLLNSDYQELLRKKISLNLMKSLCLLKNSDNSGFYKLINDTQKTTKDISNASEKALFLQEIDVIKKISKDALGHTNLFFGATVQETKEIILKAKEFVISPLFIFNERSISLFSLLKSILYVVIGFFLGMLYKGWIARVTKRFKDMSMMSIRLISNIGYYLIILIFLIISIGSLGIDMSSLSLIAGALSIGIGFGLQTVVSNLIAGIILMFERTIRIGDIIEINNVLSGTVTDMRIRSTTVKTFDNVDIVVPNSSFVQNNVINLTLEDRIRRLHIPFGVAYGTEIDVVKRVVLDALDKSSLYFIRDDEDKKTDVRMTLMNSSSVDLELIVWVSRDIKLKNISIDSDFLILIYNTLRANNINIPFPQLDVNLKR